MTGIRLDRGSGEARDAVLTPLRYDQPPCKKTISIFKALDFFFVLVVKLVVSLGDRPGSDYVLGAGEDNC